MSTPDELLPIVEHILSRIREEGYDPSQCSQTEDGQKVVQFILQVGKYNTAISQGEEISIGDILDKALLEEVRDLLRSQLFPSQPDIDWQQVSRSLLNEQTQRLTTNPLTHAEGIAYRTEQVYVPLGLVERRRQSRRQGDVLPEQGSLLYEETEITQKFELEAFLEQVLRRGQSPRSGGRRIAIIGEPGAGKTTLLQQIARWVSENIEGAISIWVSLADLQGQELEDYLLERWLLAVVQQIGQAEASTQVKDAFVAQVQQGQVWLLLDGVDEMQVSSGNLLSEIERQLRLGGLLLQSRIVLTCRLNLWDGNRHLLDVFDTYRTLEFSYPVQVEQFVGQWFGALPDAKAKQAERLCLALKQPGKERIRDLAKNPLRLTLLCFNWYLGEGTLPETKAGLYEQFVADFYEWKREQFPTTMEQRRRLNAALSELAREAIDREEKRFRLRHDFVYEFLGEPDEPDSLFQMALQLGWLNQIGVDSENRRKAVYAFFHPTFQEYFAALAIDDWHFFLNHIPDNPDYVSASYRVFNPQWKEAFLLWLGRNNLSIDSKKDLIQALVKFDDSCRAFYWERSILLVAEAIAEFDDPTYSKKTIEQLVIWSFGHFDKNQWKNFLSPLAEAAKEALIKTNRCLAILEVIDFIQYCPEDFYERYRAIQLLGELGSENSRVVGYLEDLLESSQDKWTVLQAAESLLKINSSHEKAANVLFFAFEREDVRLANATAKIIERLEIKSLTFVPRLVDLVLQYQSQIKRNSFSRDQEANKTGSIAFKEITDEENICGLLIQCLGVFSIGNDKIADILLNLLNQFSSVHIRCKIVENLSKIASSSSSMTSTFIDLLETSQEQQLNNEIVKGLGMSITKSSEAINALVNFLYNHAHYGGFRDVTESLSKLLALQPEKIEEIIDILSEILLDQKNLFIPSAMFDTDIDIFNCLGEIAFGNQQVINILTKKLYTTQSENTRYFIAKNLAKVDPGNIDAINALENLLDTSEVFDWQGCIAAIELGRILPNHPKALDYLLKAILHQKMPIQLRHIDEEFLQSSIIAQPDEVKWLTSFLDSSQGTKPIVRVVFELKKVFTSQKGENNPEYLEICYRTLWYCTQYLPYQQFYKTWMTK